MVLEVCEHFRNICRAGVHHVILGQFTKAARRQTNQERKARGKRSQTGIANIEANVCDTVRRGEQQSFGFLEADRREKNMGRYANHTMKYPVEVRGTQFSRFS